MIDKASFLNFKSLRDVRVDLERFTVLVGPNASGKSSILQGLGLLCSAFYDLRVDLEDRIFGARSRGSEGAIELSGQVAASWYRYQTRHPGIPKAVPFRPMGAWDGNGRGVSDDPTGVDWNRWTGAAGGLVPLPGSVLLRLEASNLIQPRQAPDPSLMMPDGTGVHSALANMALNEPDTWQRLQADLRRIIPTIRRLRHTKTAMNQPASLLFDTVGADSLAADQVSEGTLLVLGMLAALHASASPNLVLLDDLDRGLHPKAQKDLIALLRGLLETNHELQIIATTHSPYMLDCMETSEVRMTFLNDDGATACAALTSHPEFPKWKDEMTPGEMWSLFGEKWLVEEPTA